MNDVSKNLIATIISLAFSIFVITSTLNQEYPSAFQFAFIVGVLCLVPTTILLIQVIPRIKGAKWTKPKRIKHFIAIILILIALQLYEYIGFYVTGWILFILVSSIYSLHKLNLKTISKIFSISLIYIGVIYILFALILKVQVPEGILF